MTMLVSRPKTTHFDVAWKSILSWSAYRTQCLLTLGLLDLSIILSQIWAFRVLALVLIFTFPGIALLDALRVPRPAIGRYPAILIGASVAVIMLVGGTAHLIGNAAGLTPLSKPPLVIGFSVTLSAICGLAGRAEPLDLSGVTLRKSWLIPVLPVATAIAGAMILNHNGPSLIALVSAALAIAGLLATLVLPVPLLSRFAGPLLFSCALALLYSFSLRSNYVFGWDISTEYRVMSQTVANGYWTSNVHGNAYAAMLSITLVPATLVKTTGLDGAYVFKLIYPIFAALMPLTIYTLCRQHLSVKFAVVTPVLMVAQQAWSSMVPALARQELGLMYFTLLLVALLDPSLPSRCRRSFAVVFGIALVLSHYSTTYVTSILFVGAAILAVVFSRLGRWQASSRVPLLISAATLVIAAMIWYVPLTHSTAELSRVTSGLLENGPQILPNSSGGSPLSTWLNGNTVRPLTVSQYDQELAQNYASRSWVEPAGAPSAYPLVAAPAMPGGSRLGPLPGLVTLGNVAVNQAVNFLAIAGTAVLMVVARRRRDPRLVTAGFLSLMMVMLLGSLRVSAAIAEAYNQERMMVQGLQVLALGIGALLAALSALIQRMLNRGRFFTSLGRVVPAFLAASVGLMFLNNVGVISYFNSGNAANFANQGEDYERFYIQMPEVASAQWLAARIQPKDVLVTDRYGQLRMALFLDRKEGIVPDLAPPAIDKDSFVYLTTINMKGRDRGSIGQTAATFATPLRYLNDTKGVVYTNSYVDVYR
jgi:uncharacterized membrane protein